MVTYGLHSSIVRNIFCANGKVMLPKMGVSTVLNQFGPVHLSAVLRPLLAQALQAILMTCFKMSPRRCGPGLWGAKGPTGPKPRKSLTNEKVTTKPLWGRPESNEIENLKVTKLTLPQKESGKRSLAKKWRKKWLRSIRKSDRKVTESVPKTKKSDRTPFAALLLRHPDKQ